MAPKSQVPKRLWQQLWHARDQRAAKAVSWGVIGACSASFAYTYSAEQILQNRKYPQADREAALQRLLWARDNLMFSGRNFSEGRWWTPLTSTFCHGSLVHIAFNMTTFYSFAPALIRGIGVGPFAVLYLGGGIMSSAVSAVDRKAWNVPSLGASGGLMALLSYCAMVRPDTQFYVFGFGVRAWTYLSGFAVVSVLAQSTGSLSGIGHLAHLGGMAFGPAFYYIWRAIRFRR